MQEETIDDGPLETVDLESDKPVDKKQLIDIPQAQSHSPSQRSSFKWYVIYCALHIIVAICSIAGLIAGKTSWGGVTTCDPKIVIWMILLIVFPLALVYCAIRKMKELVLLIASIILSIIGILVALYHEKSCTGSDNERTLGYTWILFSMRMIMDCVCGFTWLHILFKK